MSYARTPAEERTLEHYGRVLGGKGPQELVESGGPVSVVQYLDFEVGVTHYATLGAGTIDIEFANPSEFVISVRPGQDAAGRALLVYAMNAAQRMAGEITFGSSLVSSDDPLISELPVYGLMFDASPWTDQLDLVLSPDEASIELAVLTVIPMTRADADFLAERGSEAYDNALAGTDADVFDLLRTGGL